MKFIDIKPPRPQKKYTPASKPHSAGKKKASGFYFFIIVLLVVIFYLSYNNSHSTDYKNDNEYLNTIDNLATQVSSSPTQTSDQQQTIPTPTPQNIVLTKEQISISILNGSGKPGIAQNIKDELTLSGYTVENIGNASNSYSKTTIYCSTTNEHIAKEIQTQLSSYPSNIEYNTTFSDDTHITVVIGEENL